MSKKPKRAKQKKGSTAPVSQVDKLISLANYQLVKGDYAAAVETCQRLLSYLPQKASQRAEVLDYLGTAQSMLQNFPESIADILPQTWGNLGICFMMKERYDEAETALKRALEIDPKYAIAKRNLAALPETRRTGPPKMVGMSDPFKETKLKQSITFVKE